jgi:hypothetical protein
LYLPAVRVVFQKPAGFGMAAPQVAVMAELGGTRDQARAKNS